MKEFFWRSYLIIENSELSVYVSSFLIELLLDTCHLPQCEIQVIRNSICKVTFQFQCRQVVPPTSESIQIQGNINIKYPKNICVSICFSQCKEKLSLITVQAFPSSNLFSIPPFFYTCVLGKSVLIKLNLSLFFIFFKKKNSICLITTLLENVC